MYMYTVPTLYMYKCMSYLFIDTRYINTVHFAPLVHHWYTRYINIMYMYMYNIMYMYTLYSVHVHDIDISSVSLFCKSLTHMYEPRASYKMSTPLVHEIYSLFSFIYRMRETHSCA